MTDPYVIFVHHTITVRRFNNMDEVQDAIKALRSRDMKFTVLKYNTQAEMYVEQEVME